MFEVRIIYEDRGDVIFKIKSWDSFISSIKTLTCVGGMDKTELVSDLESRMEIIYVYHFKWTPFCSIGEICLYNFHTNRFSIYFCLNVCQSISQSRLNGWREWGETGHNDRLWPGIWINTRDNFILWVPFREFSTSRLLANVAIDKLTRSIFYHRYIPSSSSG